MSALHGFEAGVVAGAVGLVALKYVLAHGWGYVLAKLKTALAAA